jgi:hypothetical protein
MKKLRRLLLGIVLTPIFANVLFLTGLPAAECNLAEGISDERPNQGGKPTEVSVGLRLIDVTGIQDTTQTITADFMVTQEWTDSRMIGLEGCKLKPAELWIPQIDIVNSGCLFSRLQKTVEVLIMIDCDRLSDTVGHLLLSTTPTAFLSTRKRL